jgi:hypothetical protein
MKSKLSAALAAGCCALAVSVGAAKADTIRTFDISGTFSTGIGGTLSGTLTIDVTAPGSVTAINAVYSNGLGLPYNVLTGSFPFPGGWQVIARDVAFETVLVDFSTPLIVPPAVGTLVDFNGGQILFGSVFCNFGPGCTGMGGGRVGVSLLNSNCYEARHIFSTPRRQHGARV